jgi:hypothetical protein
MLLGCSLFFTGCVAVNTAQLGPPRAGYDRPPLAADKVAVYRRADQVPGPYVEVALVHATGSLFWSSESGMYRKMREEAGRLGANAIILEPVPEPTIPEKIVIAQLNVDIGREGRAVAIYVLPPDGAEPKRPESEPGSDHTRPAPIDAPYVIRLENGSILPAATVEPSGVDQLKVTQPDGGVRYLSSNKIRTVIDKDGGDWTKHVVEERRRLPRGETGPF